MGATTIGAVDTVLEELYGTLAQAQIFPIVIFSAYIDDSSFLASPIDSASAMFLVDRHEDAIDLYLVPSTLQPSCLAESIPGTALVFVGTPSTSAVLAHAFSHCLGLYDTDETAFGVDFPNANNPGSLGDLVADTPADPGLTGWVTESCALVSGFYSAYPTFLPDTNNVMSASVVGCLSALSPEQASRMRASLGSFPPLLSVVADRDEIFQSLSAQTGIRGFEEFLANPQNAAALDFGGSANKDLLVCGLASVNENENLAVACRANGNYSAQGVPEFVDNTSETFYAGHRPANGVTGFVVADYNNDGLLDLYAPSPKYSGPGMEDHKHQLYLAHTTGEFTNETANAGLDFPGSNNDDETISGAWGDYDGDGFVDLLTLVTLSNGVNADPASCEIHLYHNVPATSTPRQFVDVTVAAGLPVDIERVLSALWVDFDQDHDMDLVLMQSVQNVGGFGTGTHSKYFSNDGDGTFTDRTLTHIPDHGEHWNNSRGVAVATDLDNDGDIDVAYHHITKMGWFYNDLNDGGVHGAGAGRLLESWHQDPEDIGTYWQTVPTDLESFDYDLDGRTDVCVGNRADMVGGVRQWIYQNLGTGSFGTGAVSNVLADCWHTLGVCAADFTMSGSTDLYLGVPRHREFFFRTTEAAGGTVSNNWIGVRLTAQNSACNSRGLGATVIVYAPGFEQAQIVDGGSGRAGQHDLDLSFGLGTIAAVDSIRVIWPCCQDQVIYSPTINQYYTIELDLPLTIATTITSEVLYNIGEETQTWVFEWETDYPSCDGQDRVIFQPAVTIPGRGTVSELNPSDDYIRHHTSSLLNGRAHHRLVWEEVPCPGQMTVSYKVRSGVGTSVSTSSIKKLTVPYCAEEL